MVAVAAMVGTQVVVADIIREVTPVVITKEVAVIRVITAILTVAMAVEAEITDNRLTVPEAEVVVTVVEDTVRVVGMDRTTDLADTGSSMEAAMDLKDMVRIMEDTTTEATINLVVINLLLEDNGVSNNMEVTTKTNKPKVLGELVDSGLDIIITVEKVITTVVVVITIVAVVVMVIDERARVCRCAENSVNFSRDIVNISYREKVFILYTSLLYSLDSFLF